MKDPVSRFPASATHAQSGGIIPVRDKHTGEPIGSFCAPDGEAVDEAIRAAATASASVRARPAAERGEDLQLIARRLKERREDAASILTGEVGKTIREARGEVDRAVETFTVAAEESSRLTGEFLPLDGSPRGLETDAIVRPMPVGPCLFITPFNFPLNLAAHKVGPAIAAGCPFILKPDPRTPLSSLLLGEILEETRLPRGSWSVLPVIDEVARDRLVTDDRISLLSFTGSGAVGWSLKAKAGRKRVVLELGGVACCVIDESVPCSDADRIAERLCIGAFGHAGQSCISVQRILVHADLLPTVREALVGRASRMVVGDPRSESTDIGPMISVDAAARVEGWIHETSASGGRVLCGGPRDGAFIRPTVVESPPAGCRLVTEEAFGPVATLEVFTDFEEALSMVNGTRFGLQAGLFTHSLDRAFRAWETLEVGAVVVNDVPTTRVDCMPYGGIKESGLGREGVRWALSEMTEPRMLVLRKIGRPPRT